MDPQSNVNLSPVKTEQATPQRPLSRISRKIQLLFGKIKDKWVSLPKRTRIALAISMPVLMVFVGAVLLRLMLTSTNFSFFKSGNQQMMDNGNWEKLVIAERETPFFTLNTFHKRKFGVFPQDTYILKTKEPIDESVIKENLSANPPVRVSAKSKQEFELTPINPLGFDEVLSISLDLQDRQIGGHTFDRNYKWAFQAEPKFAVVSTLPSDKHIYVPHNTGIEIVFNVADFADAQRFITIEPDIDFRLEKREQTLVIVPLKPLNPSSLYTVTLKKGMNLTTRNDPIESDYVFSFYTQPEQNTQTSMGFSLAESIQQTTPSEPLITKVRSYKWNYDQPVKVQVYKFASAQDFVNSRKTAFQDIPSWARSLYRYSALYLKQLNTDGLLRVSDFDVKLQKRDQIDYIQMPNSFDEGYYLIQLSYDNNEKSEQLWLQSTDLSGYVSVGKEQTAVWLNTINGGPVQNAAVAVNDTGFTASTNEQGWTIFDTPDVFFEENEHFVIATANNKQIALPVQAGYQAVLGEAADDYWSYLYHEKETYKPNDTIAFWGVAKNRDTNQAPAAVEVRLGKSYHDASEPLITQTITPQADGTFLGSVKLNSTVKSYQYLTAHVNGVEIARSYIFVGDYVKPQMEIEVESNKKAIFSGEPVVFTARASFFDGTPASQLLMKTHGMGSSENEIQADDRGEVVYEITPTYDPSGHYPRHDSVTFSPRTSAQSNISGRGSVIVYGSKLLIETDSKQDKNNAELHATVYNIDLTGINDGTSSEVKSGAAKGQKINITTIKSWYEKQEAGTYYDFVEKITLPKYNYIRHEEQIENKELITDNEGKIKYDLSLEADKSYMVKITASDSGGRQTTASDYFYYYEGQDSQPESNTQPQITTTNRENLYSIGDTVNLKITKDGADYIDTDTNRFFFVQANRGRQGIVVNDSPSFTFTFEQKHIPNIYVGAVVFTGKAYENVSVPCRWQWNCNAYYSDYSPYDFDGMIISYKKDDSKLDLSIQMNQSRYEPGSSAEVTVNVSKNGSPVGDAVVQLVLVDEALAAVRLVKEPEPLNALYETTSSHIYYSYFTHRPVFDDQPQAEGGGGGGERDLFEDTAFFDTRRTDSSGRATFTVTLPDNITSWLTYAQAVTSNMDAGHAESVAVATKDFFVTNQFPRTLLEKDKTNITANAFGIALNKESKIQYESVVSANNEELNKQTFVGGAYKDTYVPLPQLTAGDYNVAVRGEYQAHQDGVLLPLTIINSRLNFEYQSKQFLSQGQSTNSLNVSGIADDKPLSVVITDIGRGRYYYDLSKYCYVYSNRIERRLLRNLAQQILESRFDSSGCEVNSQELVDFQAVDGGIRQVSWGSSDPETSLWATYIDPNAFNKEELTAYFENMLNGYPINQQNRIMAAWGLTLLGESKLNQLQVFASSASTFEEKVLVALALVSAGEEEQAREIYYDILADYGYTNKPYIRIQADKENMDKYLRDSSIALLLGSKVLKDYNEGLHLYLEDYQTAANDVIIEVAHLAFINEELGKLPAEDTEVSFRSPTNQFTRQLTGGNHIVTQIRPSDLSNIAITVNKGKAEVITNYFVTPENFSAISADNRLKLERSFRKIKGSGTTIQTGDIVQVTIGFDYDDKDSPRGCYEVTDYVPSGLTPIENPSLYDISDSSYKVHMYQVEPNVMRACAYNSNWWGQFSGKTMVYYARANTPGTFVAEPAVVQSQLDRSIFQKTSEETITIEKME